MAEEQITSGRQLLAKLDMEAIENRIGWVMKTQEPGDDDKIVIDRGSIRKLAIFRSLAMGLDKEGAEDLALNFASQLIAIDEKP